MYLLDLVQCTSKMPSIDTAVLDLDLAVLDLEQLDLDLVLLLL